MSEENEQHPASKQNAPRTTSSPAFAPIHDFIPEDFRDFFSDSEYARLSPFSETFDSQDRTTIPASTRKTILRQYQREFVTLQTQSRRPYDHPWSNTTREPQAEDELFDAVMFEFTDCLGQQPDDVAQKFINQYDSTTVEDDIAAFKSEFLDSLAKKMPLYIDLPTCHLSNTPLLHGRK